MSLGRVLCPTACSHLRRSLRSDYIIRERWGTSNNHSVQDSHQALQSLAAVSIDPFVSREWSLRYILPLHSFPRFSGLTPPSLAPSSLSHSAARGVVRGKEWSEYRETTVPALLREWWVKREWRKGRFIMGGKVDRYQRFQGFFSPYYHLQNPFYQRRTLVGGSRDSRTYY